MSDFVIIDSSQCTFALDPITLSLYPQSRTVSLVLIGSRFRRHVELAFFIFYFFEE